MKFLKPHAYYKDITQIPWDKLGSINALVLDVDNTLVPHNSLEITQKLLDWIISLKNNGFKLCVVSNNSPKRVEGFCRALELSFIAKGAKPLPFSILKAMKLMNSYRSNTAIIGDQIFTDILGGKLAGIFTILVDPIDTATETDFIKFKRKLEAYIR